MRSTGSTNRQTHSTFRIHASGLHAALNSHAVCSSWGPAHREFLDAPCPPVRWCAVFAACPYSSWGLAHKGIPGRPWYSSGWGSACAGLQSSAAFRLHPPGRPSANWQTAPAMPHCHAWSRLLTPGPSAPNQPNETGMGCVGCPHEQRLQQGHRRTDSHGQRGRMGKAVRQHVTGQSGPPWPPALCRPPLVALLNPLCSSTDENPRPAARLPGGPDL